MYIYILHHHLYFNLVLFALDLDSDQTSIALIVLLIPKTLRTYLSSFKELPGRMK